MANNAKFTKAACGHMFKHYERAKDPDTGEYIRFGNQSIDTKLSHLNYNLAVHQSLSQGEFLRRRCSEVKVQNRKDVNVMSSWVVTAPKDLKPEDTKKFFEGVYGFLANRYGQENVVSAWVHLDETTPHIHFAFVPVVLDEKYNAKHPDEKPRWKVSAKEVISLQEMKAFHPALATYMDSFLGYHVSLLLDGQAHRERNKPIKELKAEINAEYEAAVKVREEAEKLRDELLPSRPTAARLAAVIQSTRKNRFNSNELILPKSSYDALFSMAKAAEVFGVAETNRALERKITALERELAEMESEVAKMKKSRSEGEKTPLGATSEREAPRQSLSGKLSEKKQKVEMARQSNRTATHPEKNTGRHF